VDELTGRPVPGVQIQLLYQTRVVEGSSRYLEPPVLTDANGEFFVAGHLRIVVLRPLAAAESGPVFGLAYPPYAEPLLCCYRVERGESRAYTLTVCGSRPCKALRPGDPPRGRPRADPPGAARAAYRCRGRLPELHLHRHVQARFDALTSALCAGCHGADGSSTTVGVPSLAGQPAEFLEVQLRRFRDGERASEAMEPIARELSESQSHALAEHYASLPPLAAEDDGDAALLAKGRAIATYRVCGSCHRSDFDGGGLVPRLAGQREDYLHASLLAYREQRRASPERVMVAATDWLPDEHIRALAHYLAHCR
jgi:cytochrome c553